MRTNKQAQISVLIATCNRPEMLKVCVESLLIQKTAIPYEIIILDQSDFEKLIALPSNKAAVRVTACDFKNKSRALNLGVELASADLLAVIDDDCIADKYWIDSLYKALRKEGRNFIVTGRVIAGDKESDAISSRLYDTLNERTIFKKNKITPIFKLSGCNFGFHKNTYKEIGRFNENLGPGSAFKSSDDNEWSYRALQLGFQIVYTPEAVIAHRSWRSAKEDISLMKDYGYAAGAFFKLIFKTSKLDFLYHSTQLWWWLLKTILFSFKGHEIKGYIYYGLFFFRGFLSYHHHPNRFYDYIFVLSPGKYIGGAERYVQNIVKAMRKQNKLKIIVAISHNWEFYLECKNTVPSLYLGDTLNKSSAKFSHFLKDTRATVVVSNGYHSSYLIFLTKLKSFFQRGGSKFIDIKHGWITTNFSERFETFLDRLISIFYDFVILVNPSMERSLWLVSKKKLIFIPSAISVEKDIIRTRSNKSNPLKVLLIGRLAEEKRFRLVIEALSYIPKDIWQLTVVGDGPMSDSLRNITVQKNIQDRVNFTGYQESVAQFYQDAELLVISSINEGCPLVALEAMAHGVLVLSTEVGYLSTLLDYNRGFLMDVNTTILELSKKIKEVAALDCKQRNQMINEAQLFVYENHNIERNIEIFERLIHPKSINI
ncbi:MAG: hypothetical protein COV70_01040 [Parcubacteria group bacterium CG11_big_fil_rev_8_21_14_0_20_39_22]|uniref:Glycosyl transferase family 1 domain-containing protein n=1 Tax=Candidatus Campbellbacteria bacterium CG22_combo_CG10-13_8_21_14_all_43_18 TaxID=1974530 RepID=A0A2H0DX28_9BACT|nr:MAG: hypothetical protein COW82_00490 [Candidatus Campbellbacteria bacterium CG22_combo_CG10-13_8_21_14_all_43_18]PIQ92245.1 MAG: hypothetical protein COV70_01040 [Parcubacteria group bacterium CG11_big_fil_rev_8_21_14_0_20_39_22]